MSVWVVEFFGEEKLNQLFWIITASTAPFWIMMIFFGQVRWVKNLCHPWLVPPLLVGFHIYALYLLFTITNGPEVPDVTMKGMRAFWFQPFLFLALWAHRMILDLFCGMILNRTKEGQGWIGKLSLLLVWLIGPIGLIVFGIRYWFNFRDRVGEKPEGRKTK